MVPLTKNRNEWGFVCGRISVLESRLMPYDYYVTLANLEHAEELFVRLQDTSLRDFMVAGATMQEDWSAIVDAYVNDIITLVRRDSPNPALADMFQLPEDYMNLKRAVLRSTSYPFPPHMLKEERLSEVAGGNTNLLPDLIRPSVAQLALLGADMQSAAATIDPELDSTYLRHYMALAKAVDAPAIEAWAFKRVLAHAVTALWRTSLSDGSVKEHGRNYLNVPGLAGVVGSLMDTDNPKAWGGVIPGEVGDLFRESLDSPEEEQPARFEHLVANHLTKLARLTKLQTEGPERVAGFLWGLKIEAFNMKLVISGKTNRIDSEAIRSRVRDTYV